MKSHFIHGELDMIAQRYPTLQGLLRKRLHPDKPKQVGKVWIETIQARNLDPDHFSNVCYAYAMAEKKLPDPQDQLLFAIIEEVRDLMHRDQQKLEQHEKYLGRSKYKCRSGDRWYQWMHKLLDMPEPLPEYKIAALCDWTNHGGPKPEWVDE